MISRTSLIFIVTMMIFFTAITTTTLFVSAEEAESGKKAPTFSYEALSESQKQEADAICAEYTRCSECVFDSTSVVMNRRTTVNCIWCPKTETCSATIAAGTCPSNRTLTRNPECEDMQCLGARITGNIYMCRPGMVFAAIFSIFLVILSAVYALWYRVIQQGPWRYENLESALSRLCENHGGPWNASQKAPRPDVLSADPVYVIRKKEQKRNTYEEWAFGSTEEERFWTNIKRYAFFPLAIGLLSGISCTVLLFTSSIRPYFADPYYALALIFGYGSIALMVVYARLFQPTATDVTAPQMWIDLAMFLRGRSIEKAFPIEAATAAGKTFNTATPASASGSPVNTKQKEDAVPSIKVSNNNDNNDDDQQQMVITPSSVAAKFTEGVAPQRGNVDEPLTPLGTSLSENKLEGAAETAAAASGFELDENIPADFRSKVEELVKSDEAILWYDTPDRNVVGIEFNWMYQLLGVGVGFSIFLYVLSGADPYPSLLLPPSALIVVALILTIFCFMMLVVLSAGCKRIHILTNHRLIIVARSVTGTHNVNQIDFTEIQFASLIGYREMNHFVMSVGWEQLSKVPRRMPPLHTNVFIAVSKLDSLLRLLIPRLPSNSLPPTFHDDLVHRRYVWRVHAAVNIASFILSPVIIVYSRIFPSGYGILAMLLVMIINATLIHRALRILTTTVAPITVSTGTVKTDSSFSVSKALQHVAESFPMFIPEAIKRAAQSNKQAGNNPSP